MIFVAVICRTTPDAPRRHEREYLGFDCGASDIFRARVVAEELRERLQELILDRTVRVDDPVLLGSDYRIAVNYNAESEDTVVRTVGLAVNVLWHAGELRWS